MKSIDLVILAAVHDEITPIWESMPAFGGFEIGGDFFMLQRVRELSVITGATGIGKVNAASVAAAVLTRFGPVEVWNIGCAGAYIESGLCLGDVLITRDWICGDEGVLLKSGRVSMHGIGTPLLARDGRRFFDKFPASSFNRCKVASTLPDPGRYVVNPYWGKLEAAGRPTPHEGRSFALEYGPALTVGMASGDPDIAAERYRCHGAMAENMEGSAVAQVCLRFGAPFLECRGISNTAGVRDKDQWDLKKAVANCDAVVRHLLNGVSK